ncbi:MAG: tetratricopeptide repeat protein [candidate division WOR-3 bacterium]
MPSKAFAIVTRQLAEAREKRNRGDFVGALANYEKALRTITTDDSQIMAAIELRDAIPVIRGISEYPNIDKLDSAIRTEMVEVLRELRRFDEAYHHARIAYYLDDLVWGPHHNNTAASLHDLGLIEFERHRLAEAEKWFRMSESADKEVSRDLANWQWKWRRMVRANVNASYGYFAEAVHEILTTLPEIRDKLTPYQVAQQLNVAAQLLQNLGEHEQARPLLEEAIEVQSKSAPDHPQLGRLYSNMAVLFLEMLKRDEAEDYMRKATQFGRFAVEVARQQDLPKWLAMEWGVVERWMQKSRWHFERGDKPRSYDIFISFNTQDEAVVRRLHDALEAQGLNVWWFKEQADWNRQRPEGEVRQQILSAIDNSHLVLFIASNTSFTSDWVAEEIKHSINAVVPFILWYPEGVRVVPTEASTRSVATPSRLAEMISYVFRPGVHAFYGYGLRKPDISEIAAAVLKRFISLVPGHPITRKELGGECKGSYLTPTHLMPVFIRDDGRPFFPRLIR